MNEEPLGHIGNAPCFRKWNYIPIQGLRISIIDTHTHFQRLILALGILPRNSLYSLETGDTTPFQTG